MSEPTVERFTVFGREGTNCIAAADGLWVRASDYDALTEERDRLKQWQADQVEVIDEAKALITELNADKKALEAERDRLKDQRDYYKERDEEGERIQAEIEAERDRLKADIRRISEEHARIIELNIELNKAHCRTVNSYIIDNSRRDDALKASEAERDRLAKANAELLAGLEPFAKVADQLHPGKYGPAWGFNKAIIEHEDFQKARALLDKHKATSTEGE